MPYKEKLSGQWRAQVTINGKKYRHRCQTKKEAMEWEREEKDRLLHPEKYRSTTNTVSLHDWATAYLDFSQDRHSEGTYKEKRLAFSQLFKFHDAMGAVIDFEGKDALAFLSLANSASGGNTANKRRKNLCAAWEWGVKYLGLPERNPFKIAPRFAEVREERVIPTLEDFWKVYEKTTTSQDKLMLFMYLQTGARKDELFRLEWKDIDLKSKRVSLSCKKNKVGEWETHSLPIGDDLIDMLDKHRRTTGLLGHVFMVCTPEGKWVPYSERRKWMPSLCKRAGVKPFGLHGIRHLFASILASNPRVPLVEIQKMLRHGSIATTQRYIHSLQDGSREALDALPGLIQGDVSEADFGNIEGRKAAR